MRTITKTQTVYTYDELSDTAKDAVKQWANTFEFASEDVLDGFKEVAGIIGFYDVTPRYSGFWSQGDGASFTGRYSYSKGAAKRIREYAPKDTELHAIADVLQAVQKRNFYKLTARLSLGRNSNFYAHENTIACDVDQRGDGWVKADVQDEFTELARDLMRWLYAQLEREYDYCNTDEYLSEHCAENGYEFDEDGEII